MAPIYEEIHLVWKGDEYTIQPSFRMVQRIESGGISIFDVCERVKRGEPQMSLVAQIISHMLHSGGAKRATPERVYEHLSTIEDAKEWEQIWWALVKAFIPQEPDQGNSGGPVDGAEHFTTEPPEKLPPQT